MTLCVFLFTPGILLQHVINGFELECEVCSRRSLPQFVSLPPPVLLLGGVLDVGDGLGPGVNKSVGEVLGQAELLLELSVELPDQSGSLSLH